MIQSNEIPCLAPLIDHTILRPDATSDEVVQAAYQARDWGVATLCVAPVMVGIVAQARIDIPISSVVGFPSGQHRREVKVYEALLAVEDGAQEIDMVINLAALCAGEYQQVRDEIICCREAIANTTLKVIIESALLQQIGGHNLIIQACHLAEEAGADFVKTSTGFHPAGGASLDAVSVIAQTVGTRLGVKASGGIRTKHAARAMITAGATRLGLSQTHIILAD